MEGRVDFDRYKAALKTCLNHIPLVQGGVTRRPGTMFVAETKNSAARSRLVRFEFSVTQAYVLEFGNLYVRVYRNHGRNESPPGTPVEIVTPYTTADIPSLMFTQSADVLYIAHPSYPPAKITRASDTSWSYAALAFTDGPYLNQNTGAITLTLGASAPGVTTLTASSALFAATDVGRPVRLQVPTKDWAWGVITGYTDSTHVAFRLEEDAGATTATDVWRLGLWSATTGYPACVTFYQDRLVFGGGNAGPESLQFSVTGNYTSHQPTAYDADGTVVDSHALNITLASNDVQYIRWMSGDAGGLLVGTSSGEWAVSPSSLGGALTPTNINAVQMTAYGSAQVRALKVGYTTLMVQRSLRKVRELTFVYYENKYHAPDMTVIAQHITRGGIGEIAYQQEPNSILWATRGDGVLLGFTYERDQNVLGWHRHVLGGTNVEVESVATIPAPGGAYDELWVIVKRTINGGTKRYVEYMTKMWEKGDTQATACYSDSALAYSGAAASSVTGLSHLIGETVAVLADGSVHPPCVVNGSGAITLNRAASNIVVGLAYNSDGQTLRREAGAANGTAQGKTQRTNRINFRLYEALGLSVGPDFDNLTRIPIRTTADEAGVAVPLYTGDLNDTWDGDYSTEDLQCWRFSDPLPGTILLVAPQLSTQDR
jgi:hypothetical protein